MPQEVTSAPAAGAPAVLQPAGLGPGSSPSDTVRSWLGSLETALAARDLDAATALFEEGGFWRDLVAFTWNLKTSEGRGEIRDMLAACLEQAAPSDFALEGEASAQSSPALGDTIEGWITFRTAALEGKGYVRLRNGLAWTLLTTAQSLRDFPEPRGTRRPLGAQHGAHRDRRTWLDEREAEARELGYTRQPYTVIVGGGQGALALAARLRVAGVPTIVVERNKRPGDSWRNRYKPLCLHDPVWYDNLPYLPFPDTWPVFSPKDKIGDWLEMYAKVMEINYWASTSCLSASFDEDAQEWTVNVRRTKDDGTTGKREDWRFCLFAYLGAICYGCSLSLYVYLSLTTPTHPISIRNRGRGAAPQAAGAGDGHERPAQHAAHPRRRDV